MVDLWVRESDVHLRADDREGRAQLVRSISHEIFLRLERRVQSLEHLVERIGKIFQFVSWSLESDALVQCGSRQAACGARHLLEGSQHASGHQPSQSEGDHRHDRQGHPGHEHELAKGLIVKFPLHFGYQAADRHAVYEDPLLGVERHARGIQELRRDVEPLGNHRPSLVGGRAKGIPHQEVVEAEHQDCDDDEQTPVPQGQAEPDSGSHEVSLDIPSAAAGRRGRRPRQRRRQRLTQLRRLPSPLRPGTRRLGPYR